MMKRTLCITLFCAFALTLFSQKSINQLYHSFAHEQNVEKVQVSGLLMWLAKPFIKDSFSGSISGVKVLSLDECSDEVKARFNREAANFNDSHYEPFLKTNDKEEKVRIFVKFKDEKIREMIILTMGKEPSMVTLKGKISPEDVQKMTVNKK